MRSRRAALAAGAVVIVAYVGGALISAHLSPVARRPLLDGLAPPAPYRWVTPPPELADANQPPTPGRFTLALDPSGAEGGAFTTRDAQVTVIVPNDAIGPSSGQRSVGMTIDPLDPAMLGRPPRSLVVLGNAVRIRAAYEPNGDPIDELLEPIEVVLTYPFVLSDAGDHTLLVSEDGNEWSRVRTADHLGPSQAIGSMASLGYVMVAGRRLENVPSASPSATPDRDIPLPVIGAGVLAVLLVLAIVLRGRGDRRRRSGHG